MDRREIDAPGGGPADLAIGAGLSELLSAVLAVDPRRAGDPTEPAARLSADLLPAARLSADLLPADLTSAELRPAVGADTPPPIAADLVERAAATLSPDVRAFVHAYFRDGQPIDTAAARLGISRLDALALRSAAVTRLTEALVEIRRA